MSSPLPLFDDSRDFADTRVHLHSYRRIDSDRPRDTLLLVRGYGRAIRMPESSALAFLADRGFAPADGIGPRTVHHRDGAASTIREWTGPHGTSARTTTGPVRGKDA